MLREQFETLDKPIAVVAHDAGAANLLSAWFSEVGTHDVYGCMAGPAKAIFEREHPTFRYLPLVDLVMQSRTLISGTGWASNLEHDARIIANETGCRNITVLDHWTDYKLRFNRSGKELLPDFIWVVDDYAAQLVRSNFPDLPLAQLPNTYLAKVTAAVGVNEWTQTARKSNILYVLEPIRDDWGQLPRAGEFLALDYFVSRLESLGFDGQINLRLRPHPSDPPGKYDEWLLAHRHLQPTLDHSPTLESALAWSGTVAGCQTYAMVLGLAAGRRVICTIPPNMPVCALPHRDIIHLAQL